MKFCKSRNINLMVICIFLLSKAQVVNAEDLSTLYEKALNYDAQYKAAQSSNLAEEEEVNKVKSQYLPKVQLTANVGRGATDRSSQTINGDVESHQNYRTQNYALTVKQALYNQENNAALNTANASAKSSEEQLRRERIALFTRVSNAYIEAAYANEKSMFIQTKIEAINQQLIQAQKKQAHGEGTVVEISEAEASLELAKAELIEAQNVEASNLQLLSDMVGEPVNNITKLNPEKLSLQSLAPHSLDDCLAIAVERNPEIAAAKFKRQASLSEVERKRAGHYPTVDLVGVRSYSESDNNNTIGSTFDTSTLTLQVNMPLYAGGYVNASIRQAQAKFDAADEEFNYKLRGVQANIKRFYNNIQSELRSINAYQQAVKAGKTAYTGTEKGFKAGIRSNIDVLNAQQKWVSSALDLSKAHYMLVNDMINLKQNIGALEPSDVLKISELFSIQ